MIFPQSVLLIYYPRIETSWKIWHSLIQSVSALQLSSIRIWTDVNSNVIETVSALYWSQILSDEHLSYWQDACRCKVCWRSFRIFFGKNSSAYENLPLVYTLLHFKVFHFHGYLQAHSSLSSIEHMYVFCRNNRKM